MNFMNNENGMRKFVVIAPLLLLPAFVFAQHKASAPAAHSAPAPHASAPAHTSAPSHSSAPAQHSSAPNRTQPFEPFHGRVNCRPAGFDCGWAYRLDEYQ